MVLLIATVSFSIVMAGSIANQTSFMPRTEPSVRV